MVTLQQGSSERNDVGTLGICTSVDAMGGKLDVDKHHAFDEVLYP